MLHAHQQVESALLVGAGESVEHQRVLADHLTNLERDALAQLRQSIVGAEGDQHFVADASRLDDDAARVANHERA